MEFETYEDVIDAFERDNMGYDTLTDYIKGENIKIKEIDMSPMKDLKDALSSKKGIMNILVSMNMKIKNSKARVIVLNSPLGYLMRQLKNHWRLSVKSWKE